MRADIDAARGAIPDLAGAGREARGRDAEGERRRPPISPRSPPASTRSRRALAAPKNETRVVAEKLAAADNATAIAIIAEVAEDKLRSGAPFAPELAALQRLGVDPATLAPLQAVVNGAPTNGALAASFDAVAPKVLAADVARASKAAIVDRFLAHLHGLVQVRDLNETPGDDPQALVSQIEAASRRGDIGGALAAFDKLPEAARQAAGRLGDAGPREAGGGRGASVDPRGGDRAARGRPKTVRPRPPAAGGLRRHAGVLKRRRDGSPVDFPRRAGAGRLGPDVAREQSGRRGPDLAGRRNTRSR